LYCVFVTFNQVQAYKEGRFKESVVLTSFVILINFFIINKYNLNMAHLIFSTIVLNINLNQLVGAKCCDYRFKIG